MFVEKLDRYYWLNTLAGMTCIRRKNTPEEKRLVKKMRRQRKCQLKRATKEDLSKQLMEAKCKAKFNWKLASTYWDR